MPGGTDTTLGRYLRPMACTLHVAWTEAMIGYDFGPGHPLAPVRLDLTMRLARELGVLDRAEVTMVEPDPADDALLGLVHEPEYIAAVRTASEGRGHADPAHGLGTPDNPVFAGMHDASALVAGATVAAAQAVWSGTSEHGINVAGGLHHAMPDQASGFCVYNDPAIAIAWLLEQGAERIAYVDVDVHHGDGVQTVFWDDPRVLTISLHETGNVSVSRHGLPDRDRRTRRRGIRGERCAATWHRRRRMAPGVPRDRAATARGVRPGRPGEPAGLRQPRRGPARAPRAQRRRPARVLPGIARFGPLVRRRTLARHRRRRLRAGRRRPPGVDPSARDRHRPPARPGDSGARTRGATTCGRGSVVVARPG